MMKNPFKEKLKQGENLCGTLITLPAAEVSEIAARAGFDWLFIDTEHSALGMQEVQRHLIAAGDTPCLVRVPGHSEEWTKRALDAGADGILFPQVNNAEQARRLVSWCRYPPEGKRSAGIARAQAYGMDLREYASKANRLTAVVIQIEHVSALDHLEEIAGVQGVDAWFVGPYDLELSMTYGNAQNLQERLSQAIEQILLKAQAHDIPCGIYAADAATARQRLTEGFRFTASGTDAMLLSTHYKSLADEMKKK